jgi:hypothetical protein
MTAGAARTAALFRARDALAATRDPAAAAQAAMAAADEAWATLRPAVERAGALACRAGCTACCHQRVAVLPAEADLIARHVAAHDPGRRARLAAPRGPRDSCPFLDCGACTIYAVRPLRCRGVHSRDATVCRKWPEDRVADGLDRDAFPPEPIAVMDAALAGLGQALRDGGHDTATLELAAAVLARLDPTVPGGGEEAVASPAKTPIFPA